MAGSSRERDRMNIDGGIVVSTVTDDMTAPKTFPRLFGQRVGRPHRSRREEVMNRVCVSSGIILLALCPHVRLAAQETSMIFVEAPTLLATFVRPPENYDPNEHRTVIVALHGFGSSAEQFITLSSPITSAGIIFAAVRAPYTMVFDNGRIGYDWNLQHLGRRGPSDRAAELTVDYIGSVLAGLRERYQATRVFLLGFSQGGAFAYMSGVANHSSLDGLIVFGAGFDESWFPDGDLAEARGLPIFLAHGETDDAVSIAESERARDTLTRLGYDVTFRPFAAGHGVPLNILGEVAEWTARR